MSGVGTGTLPDEQARLLHNAASFTQSLQSRPSLPALSSGLHGGTEKGDVIVEDVQEAEQERQQGRWIHSGNTTHAGLRCQLLCR